MSAKNRTQHLGLVFLTAILGLHLSIHADTERDPGSNPYGTLGMTNLVSAEAMGDGRLTLKVRGNFFEQNKSFPGGPEKGTQITTVNGAIAYGMNAYMDAFMSISKYSSHGRSINSSGDGTSVLGFQGSIPFAESFPARLGMQLATLYGTSRNQINNNGLDGYNYLETRKYTDLMLRLSQSFLYSDANLKFHLNEGAISSFQPGKDMGLLAGAGIEYSPISPLILGMEINWRTFRRNPTFSDPLWITPSLVYWTPVHLSIETGMDIAISQTRSGNPSRALEPWRIFGAFSFTTNILKDKRHEVAEKAKRDSLERVRLLDELRTAHAYEDSVERQRTFVDSMMAQARRNADELRRQLDEERSKRSDMEKHLLSTGLLLLDAMYFETGRSEISINSKPYLNIIAKMLLKYPKLQLEVAGHTDNVGGARFNQSLSQARANAVVNYMLTVAPELRNNLTARGYGYSDPRATNRTAEGRKQNRRTELRVTNREMLREYNP